MNLEPIDDLLTDAIRDGAFPGAAFAIRHGDQVRKRYFGRQTYCPESREIGESTIWDLASLTKVVATTTVAMKLHEHGKLDLDRPVSELIPEFSGDGKDGILIKNLLVHDAGLKPDIPYIEHYFDRETIVRAIFAEPLEYATGSRMVYSDLSMILLQSAIERITGVTLDEYANEHIFEPLKMRHTRFSPSALDRKSGESRPDLCQRSAPTEVLDPWRKELRDRRFTGPEQVRLFGPTPAYIQAEVHDPTAAVMEGVAGHAGLFSTLDDLVKFMTGLTDGKLVKKSTLAHWTKCQSDLSSRALGWDTKSSQSSAGDLFGERSFGHTGYTGTSIWCDPDHELFAILLTNRVHPTADNNKIRFVRPAFHDAVFNAAIA